MIYGKTLLAKQINYMVLVTKYLTSNWMKIQFQTLF